MVDEMTPQQTLEWKAAQYDAMYASHHKLQVEYDAHLQAHEDLKAAHAETIDNLKAEHQVAIQKLSDAHDAAIREHTNSLKNEHDSRVAQLKADHERHVAELKDKHLLPAVRDLHARKQADLAAQLKAAEAQILNG